MVCDGDSKAYNTGIHTKYDDCHTYENMDKKSPAYKQWLNSEQWEKSHVLGEANCRRVNKLDTEEMTLLLEMK